MLAATAASTSPSTPVARGERLRRIRRQPQLDQRLGDRLLVAERHAVDPVSMQYVEQFAFLARRRAVGAAGLWIKLRNGTLDRPEP